MVDRFAAVRSTDGSDETLGKPPFLIGHRISRQGHLRRNGDLESHRRPTADPFCQHGPVMAGTPKVVGTTAIDREMVGFIWGMARAVTPVPGPAVPQSAWKRHALAARRCARPGTERGAPPRPVPGRKRRSIPGAGQPGTTPRPCGRPPAHGTLPSAATVKAARAGSRPGWPDGREGPCPALAAPFAGAGRSNFTARLTEAVRTSGRPATGSWQRHPAEATPWPVTQARRPPLGPGFGGADHPGSVPPGRPLHPPAAGPFRGKDRPGPRLHGRSRGGGTDRKAVRLRQQHGPSGAAQTALQSRAASVSATVGTAADCRLGAPGVLPVAVPARTPDVSLRHGSGRGNDPNFGRRGLFRRPAEPSSHDRGGRTLARQSASAIAPDGAEPT